MQKVSTDEKERLVQTFSKLSIIVKLDLQCTKPFYSVTVQSSLSNN